MEKKNNYITSLLQILQENQEIIRFLDNGTFIAIEERIKNANAIFFAGAGRTGLALKMGAMRFMHLGFQVYVVGETTTPAILENDLLIVGSGSGTTSTLVSATEKAKKQGAKIVAITADEKSKIATLADNILPIRAALKTDFGLTNSQQYAGSLFEQSVLLALDALFMTIWQSSGLTKEDLWPKHANLE